jgi:hypothetical protein
VGRSGLAVVLERDVEDLPIDTRPGLRVEGDLETDLVRVGVVEAPADLVTAFPVGDDRDRAGRQSVGDSPDAARWS